MAHHYSTRISTEWDADEGYVEEVDFASNPGMMRLHFRNGTVKEYRYAYEREVK